MSLPGHLKQALARIPDEVLSHFYGCGLIAPEALWSANVLDLGCGSGRDCYVLSQWVGPDGLVVGVDMTDEQLDIANRHVEYHRDRSGFPQSNLRFVKGYIEALNELDLEPASFDIIVSNCVINLSPDKAAVLRGAYDLLKPGGEMYFSDVYADRRIPKSLSHDPELFGECLSGALYWNDFEQLAKESGFLDPRIVSNRPIELGNESLQQKVDGINFFSVTYRLFKLPDLESDCEDYGQAVIYRGGIEHHGNRFDLDRHHAIEAQHIFPVCGNTWRMLHDTRFRNYFEFIGNFDRHFGLFEGCGSDAKFDPKPAAGQPAAASCC